jgi:hypothetical protein
LVRGAAIASGGAGVCVAPALIPPKLAGGFAVAFDCRGVSAPAEVSIPYLAMNAFVRWYFII